MRYAGVTRVANADLAMLWNQRSDDAVRREGRVYVTKVREWRTSIRSSSMDAIMGDSMLQARVWAIPAPRFSGLHALEREQASGYKLKLLR